MLYCRATATPSIEQGMVKKEEAKSIPEPVIKIDNHTDPYHTIVSITYGDKLGELSDTVRACVCWLPSWNLMGVLSVCPQAVT